MKVSDITPYGSNENKESQVEAMFDNIAPAYDFMNSAMSFGLHRRWRAIALKSLKNFLTANTAPNLLDIATGTGDLAFQLNKLFPQSSIIGIDISNGMLDIAKKKKSRLAPYANINFLQADSLQLPFDNESFDAITVAYGVRNFADLPKGLKEMNRVLKKDGLLCIIELSEPTLPPLKFLYSIYAHHLIPAIGKLVSGDSRAYSYLPESIAACPQRQNMLQQMNHAGFSSNNFRSLTFGVVTIYFGKK